MNILDLLDKRGIEYKLNIADNASITCPNAANHEGGFDANPSFNISLSGRGSHCLACGFKLSPTGTLKWLLGEELDEGGMRCLELRGRLKRIEESSFDLPVELQSEDIIFPPGEPVTEPYRGISVETYQTLGSVIVRRGRYKDRLCQKIVLNGVLIGIDGRDLTGEASAKYLRNYNSTCSHNWLFPYDHVKEMIKRDRLDYVILGEGAFHAINGFDKGFPTLTYFGANNFSMNKAIMLMGLGVSEVILFPDRDEAGAKAVTKIGEMLKNWFTVSIASTEHFELDLEATRKKGKLVYQDLGDLSREQIEIGLEGKRRLK